MILSTLKTVHRFGIYFGTFPGTISQVRYYAARKGTREKAKKKKVKVEIKKLTFAEKVRKSKKITITKPDAMVYDDTHKPDAVDDVYIQKYFKYKLYPFEEAIQCHREYLHPTMYNEPDAVIKLIVELNMQGVKKTKPIGSFHKIMNVTHNFPHGEERNILVFCKTEDQVKEALDAGAALAGGSDIVKLILSGDISLHNYDTILAHPNAMPEVLTLRGILKKKHPSIKSGTLGVDLSLMVRTHLHGIKYVATPYEHFPEYGTTSIPIGLLSMDIPKLEENLKDAINSVMSAKPKRSGHFITRLRVECPPSLEKLKINHTLYIEQEKLEETEKEEELDNQEDVAIAISPA